MRARSNKIFRLESEALTGLSSSPSTKIFPASSTGNALEVTFTQYFLIRLSGALIFSTGVSSRFICAGFSGYINVYPSINSTFIEASSNFSASLNRTLTCFSSTTWAGTDSPCDVIVNERNGFSPLSCTSML